MLRSNFKNMALQWLNNDFLNNIIVLAIIVAKISEFNH